MTDFEALVPESLRQHRAITGALSRLAGITGFVTTVCTDDDQRPRVFNRLDHLVRVDMCSRALGRHFDLGTPSSSVAEAVWLHDLNRWPFAHNLERGRYEQLADLPGFLASRGVVPSAPTMAGITALHRWDTRAPDLDSLLVLAADKLTGLVEDVLLAICGLNITPSFFSEELRSTIGLEPVGSQTHARLERLASMFRHSHDGGTFGADFHELFTDGLERCLEGMARVHGRHTSGLRDAVESVREIRRTEVSPRLFPINNDLVCHRDRLEAEVFGPLFASGAPPSVSELLELDDTSAAAAWSARSDLARLTPAAFVADLDAVSTRMPDIAFV